MSTKLRISGGISISTSRYGEALAQLMQFKELKVKFNFHDNREWNITFSSTKISRNMYY